MNEEKNRKDLGAFYTPPQIADFLVNWAVRSSSDLIFGPSFGEGKYKEYLENITASIRALDSVGIHNYLELI